MKKPHTIHPFYLILGMISYSANPEHSYQLIIYYYQLATTIYQLIAALTFLFEHQIESIKLFGLYAMDLRYYLNSFHILARKSETISFKEEAW